VRRGDQLRSAFEVHPDYLKDSTAHDAEVNFSDLGLQLTRSSRALKLWLSLGYFGVDAFRDAIDNSIDLALLAEGLIAQEPELEVISSAQLGIVCFRRLFDGADEEWKRARLNAALVGQFEQSGLGLVSSTTLGGRYAIRLCILNHTTTRVDVERTIEWFARAPVPSLTDPSSQMALSLDDRTPSVADSWTGDAAFEVAELASLPLFMNLPPQQLARVAAWSGELRATAGETIIERWEGARDFYVIVEGDADVFIEEEHVRHLSEGDFFGEVAALDWGSGFGYVRTATVVAATDVRLLVLGPAALGVLLADYPPLGSRLRDVAHERLHQM
jgi:CRP-like cAMP-binding protein